MCELPGNQYTAATMAARACGMPPMERKSAIDSLHEFATQQLLAKDSGGLTHPCFAALAAGDTARFGELLARELNRSAA